MTMTMVGFASFGPHPLPHETGAEDTLLLYAGPSPRPLAHYRFQFVDDQPLRPGAHGMVRMTFPEGQALPAAGPLPIGTDQIVGQIWGLHLDQASYPTSRPTA